MERINPCDNINEKNTQHQLMSLLSTPLFIPMMKEQKQNCSIPIYIKNFINTCKRINNTNLACNYNIGTNSQPSVIRSSKSQILKIPSYMLKKFNLKTLKKIRLSNGKTGFNYSKHGTIKNINDKEDLGLPNKIFLESISISPQKKITCPNAPRISRNTNIRNNRMNYYKNISQNIFPNSTNLNNNNRIGSLNNNLMSINNNYYNNSNFNSCMLNTTNTHTVSYSNSNSNNSNDSNGSNNINNNRNHNHHHIRNTNNMIFNGNSVKSINKNYMVKNAKKVRIKRNNNRTASLDLELEYKDRKYSNILINDFSENIKSSLAHPKQLMKSSLDSSKTIKASYSKSILSFDSQKYYISISNKPQDTNNYLKLKKKFTYSSSQGNIDVFSSIKSIHYKNNHICNNGVNNMNNPNSLFNNCPFNPDNKTNNDMLSFQDLILNNNLNEMRGIHNMVINNNKIEETNDSGLNSNYDSFSNLNDELSNSNAHNTFPILNALRRLGEEANIPGNSNIFENQQSDDETNFSTDSNLSFNSL